MELLFNCDCIDFLKSEECKKLLNGKKVILVTEPPFDIGYNYKTKKKKLKKEAYYNMLETVFTLYDYDGLTIIHYPEQMFEIALKLNKSPEKVVSWVYNSNTVRQHKDIAYFGVKPDFRQVLQPYKNVNDKRIKDKLAKGIKGGKLYDWWKINEVKNVSTKKYKHPCIMPVEVMKNVVGILPKDVVILDCFMGSGTTGVACKELGYDFIGIEIDKEYFDLAKRRIENTIRRDA